MVTRRFNLVYGGGSIGLMGVVSQIVHQGGCNVLGLNKYIYGLTQIIGTTTGHVKPVIDMHQRKTKMMRESDCFIALPGGYGTLEELFEVISWAQLGVHVKPFFSMFSITKKKKIMQVGLLNVNGYYNHLLSMIDKAVQDEFIKPFDRNILVTASTVKELINKLEVSDSVCLMKLS
ncbi:unnamed protein product [Linum tenue]|uniref:Cytokinin riboside 5'-monophosphate phosphoribohydrolase n=1 Tax=Linum tenue TaxID=586396 RepID=A0AAV0KAI2_9ROSI|nr:unnamed protein product [Linum tenue]